MQHIHIYTHTHAYLRVHTHLHIHIHIISIYIIDINPPAPKVPRRGSLAVDSTGQVCQGGAASAGGHFRQKGR